MQENKPQPSEGASPGPPLMGPLDRFELRLLIRHDLLPYFDRIGISS